MKNLDQKVISINTLYNHAEQIIAYELEKFKPFVGKNIFKKDGSLMAKYEHEKLKFEGKTNEGVYFNTSYYFENKGYGSFNIVIRGCVNGPTGKPAPFEGFCIYDTVMLTLFKVDETGAIVENNADREYLKKRYTAAEILQQLEKVKEAAENYKKETAKIDYAFHDVLHLERLSR